MKRCIAILSLTLAACGTPTNNDGADASSPPADAGPDSSADAGTSDSGEDANVTDDAGPPPCEPIFLGPDDDPFDTLSEYCLFDDLVQQSPAAGVLPFEPIAVLYADESLKQRYIAVPDGEQIEFDPDERFVFPDGTTLVKTFFYYDDATNPGDGRRLLETRLIVRQDGEWNPYIYVWNEEQTEANFERLGGWLEFDRVDDRGETVSTRYRVPNRNQCGSCHDQSDQLLPLGPRAYQLDKDYDYGGDVGTKNQIEHWASLGLFDVEPPASEEIFALTDYLDETADLDSRARSYLEVNCAHCHSTGGAADPSGLKLNIQITEPGELGICRRPVAAGAGSGGYFYDIVPGMPDESIMVYRMSSTDPEIKMPELPTQTADDFGVMLIRDWISAMEPAGCPD